MNIRARFPAVSTPDLRVSPFLFPFSISFQFLYFNNYKMYMLTTIHQYLYHIL